MIDDIQSLRKDNFKRLIEKYGNGNQTFFGKAINVNPSYINHVVNGRRGLGPAFCRRIENTLGIVNGWMDTIH